MQKKKEEVTLDEILAIQNESGKTNNNLPIDLRLKHLKVYYNSNIELKTILSLVSDMPVFYEQNKKLLSVDEIINYKENLNITDELIPLIYLSDNDFVVYDINTNNFALYNIVDDLFFENLRSINDYINSIKLFFNNKLSNFSISYNNIQININSNKEISSMHIEQDFKTIQTKGIENLIKEELIPWLLNTQFVDKDKNKVCDGLKINKITYHYGLVVEAYSPTKKTDYFGQFEFIFVSANDYTKDILEACSMIVYIKDDSIVNVEKYDV